MNEYMKPDYEVMVFEANESVSACYIMDSSANASAAGWCQATDTRFYDMNNTLDMDDDTYWTHQSPSGGCNNNQFESATYQIVAKDVVQVEDSTTKYWANSYKADNTGTEYKKPNSLGGHNLFISFFFGTERHAMQANNFTGLVNAGSGHWTNHS